MLKDIFSINAATGISITINPDGTFRANACSILKKGDQLDFTKKLAGAETIQALSEELQKDIPVALNLSGKGILLKQTEKAEELDPIKFSQLLPNAGFEDFYIQNFVSGDQSFISVIRKSEAVKWINELESSGFNVVMLTLSVFVADIVLPQINFYDTDLIFDGHIIQRDEQRRWIKYRYQQSEQAGFQLKIESEKIDEALLLPYASAFRLVMTDRISAMQAPVPELAQKYQKTINNKWAKGYGAVVLVIVFILLLINFFLFSYVDGDNSKLALRVSRSAQSTSDVKGIEEQVKAKEQKLQALGWDGGIKKAYLIDQLAASLPNDITWQSIEVNPVDQAGTRLQRSIRFKDRQILIAGLSAQIIPVNEWMARIRILKWVKGVQLENYGFDQELQTGRFTLVINY